MNEEKSSASESSAETSDADWSNGDETVIEVDDDMQEDVMSGRSSSGVVSWLAILLAVGAMVGSFYVWNQMQDGQQASGQVGGELSQIKQELATTISQIGTLQSEFTNTRSALDGGQDNSAKISDAVTPLAQRLAALESGVIEMRSEDGGVSEQLSPISARLAELEQSAAQVAQARAQQESEFLPLGRKIDKLEQELAAVRSEIQAQNQEATQALRDTQDKINTDLQNNANLQSGTQVLLKSLQESLGRNQEAWRLMEAKFLLGIANQRLHLQRDTHTATAALMIVDEQLQAVNNPEFIAVRERLAQEISALRLIQLPDISGIALAITELVKQVRDLKVEGSDYEPPELSGVSDQLVDMDVSKDWRELPGVVWGALSELVQVRRTDEPVGRMLAPDEQYFLYENMRLKLEAARIAVLREDKQNYWATLLEAKEMLSSNFAHSTSHAQSMLMEFERLLAIDVRPDLPDISGSLRLLRQLTELNTSGLMQDTPLLAQSRAIVR